jgi:hypothetical protein
LRTKAVGAWIRAIHQLAGWAVGGELQYFFLNPLQYGILLTSALYILISLTCGISSA